jgi:FAD/FMN-containing dehydrogenase
MGHAVHVDMTRELMSSFYDGIARGWSLGVSLQAGRNRLYANMHRRTRIAADAGLMISVIAHAGDGNTHPLIVYDADDAAMTARAHKAFGDIMDLAISLGGTITGEHGVGRLKKPWLAGQLGPEVMALNRRIKDALDPDGILNPGALI